MSSAPMSYELDGRQYVVFPAAGSIYAFALTGPGYSKTAAH